MEKKYITIFLCIFVSSLLLSADKHKQWRNKKCFQNTVERLIRNCINHEKRLLEMGKSIEEAKSSVFKSNDSHKFSKLRKQNPHFEEIIMVELRKKIQESL